MSKVTGVATVVVVLAACGASPPKPPAATPTPEPTPAPATAAATPIARTDQEKVALVRENIGIVWCDDAPRPDWCEWLRRKNGKVVVEADGTNLTIGVRSATPIEAAEELCRNMATTLFDDNAVPLGFDHIDVESAPERFIADCLVQ